MAVISLPANTEAGGSALNGRSGSYRHVETLSPHHSIKNRRSADLVSSLLAPLITPLLAGMLTHRLCTPDAPPGIA